MKKFRIKEYKSNDLNIFIIQRKFLGLWINADRFSYNFSDSYNSYEEAVKDYNKYLSKKQNKRKIIIHDLD